MDGAIVYVKETIERVSEGQFQLFKTLHEIRLRDAYSPRYEINKAKLLEVDREDVVVLKQMCTNDQIAGVLEMLNPADIAMLSQRKGAYIIVMKEFDLWIKTIVNTKKKEYLQSLISGEKPAPKPFADYLDIDSDAAKAHFIAKITPMVNQKSGKTLATIVIALEETGILLHSNNRKALFESMTEVFGSLGSLSGFQYQITHIIKETRSEIDSFKEHFNSFL